MDSVKRTCFSLKHVETKYGTIEPQKTPSDFPLYGLFNRDPYNIFHGLP